MTTTGLAHFIVDNLLDKVGLNPTWEKVRRYLYTIGAGISLFTLYFTLKIDVECAPAYENGTVIDSKTRSWHVNEYCRDSKSLWLTRYCACLLVTLNIVILGTGPCWLHMPKIIDSFRTFEKIQKLFDEIHSSYQGFRNMRSTFMKPTDKVKTQLRQLIRLLFKLQETSRYTSSKACCHRCCFDMSKSYISRCWLLLAIFWISAVISIAFGIVIYMKGDMYSCTYNLKAENEYYICTTDVALRIAFFNLAGGSVYLLQMLPTVWGIWKAKKAVKSVNGNSMEYPVIRLILTFWRSSTSSNSGLLRECIEEFVFSGRFYKAVVENRAAPNTEMANVENGDAPDTETVVIENGDGPDTERAVNKNGDGPDTKRAVNKNGDTPDPDLTELARFMERAFSPLSVLTYKHRKYNSDRFRNFICNSAYKLEECFWLAELLVKHELWATFVILLKEAKDLTLVNDETMKRFERLNVNFDSLASADTEVERLDDDFYDEKTMKKSNDTHSLLYYAAHVENLNVAIFLLSCFKPSKPYVHYRKDNKLESKPAKAYFESLSSSSSAAAAAGQDSVSRETQRSENAIRHIESVDDNSCTDNTTILSEIINECDSQSNENFRCQWVLQKELDRYKSMKTPDKDKSMKKRDKDKSMKKLDKDKSMEKQRHISPDIVARRKFRKWDETAIEFFESAVTKNDRKMKKALLRAYFPDSPFKDLGKGGPTPSEKCIDEMIKGFKRKYVFNDCTKLLDDLLEKGKLDKCIQLLNEANWKGFELPLDWKDRLGEVNIKYNRENKERPFRLEKDQNIRQCARGTRI